MSHIEKIVVTYLNSNVNASCAMLKNGTAFALYTSNYHYEDREQVEISLKFVADPDTPSVLNIPDIAFIKYGTTAPGNETLLCSP